MVTTAAEWQRHLNQQQLDHVIQSRQAAKTPSPIASPKSSHNHVSSPIGSPSPERLVRTPEPPTTPVDRFGRSPEPLISPSPERLTRGPWGSPSASPHRRTASPSRLRTAGPSPQRLARDPRESPSPSPQPSASPGQQRLASPSPQRTASPSPLRLVRDPQESPSPSPQRTASPSPLRLAKDPRESASPSPRRTASPGQLRLASPSPQRTASPGQLRLASPSPQRTASPSPLTRRLVRDPQESPSPSPQQTASPSPLRLARNSQESASALPDPFTAPIQVDGDNRQRHSSPHLPIIQSLASFQSQQINDDLEDDEDGVYETDDEDVAGAMSRGLISTESADPFTYGDDLDMEYLYDNEAPSEPSAVPQAVDSNTSSLTDNADLDRRPFALTRAEVISLAVHDLAIKFKGQRDYVAAQRKLLEATGPANKPLDYRTVRARVSNMTGLTEQRFDCCVKGS
jgi:hypothetical protein